MSTLSGPRRQMPRQSFWQPGPVPVTPSNEPLPPPAQILKFPRKKRTRTRPEDRPDMTNRPAIAGSVSRVGRLEVEAYHWARFSWVDLEALVWARKDLWAFAVVDDDGRFRHEYLARPAGDAWKDVPDPNRPPALSLFAGEDDA